MQVKINYSGQDSRYYHCIVFDISGLNRYYWIGASDFLQEGTFLWPDGSAVQMGAPFWGGVSKWSSDENWGTQPWWCGTHENPTWGSGTQPEGLASQPGSQPVTSPDKWGVLASGRASGVAYGVRRSGEGV